MVPRDLRGERWQLGRGMRVANPGRRKGVGLTWKTLDTQAGEGQGDMEAPSLLNEGQRFRETSMMDFSLQWSDRQRLYK